MKGKTILIAPLEVHQLVSGLLADYVIAKGVTVEAARTLFAAGDLSFDVLLSPGGWVRLAGNGETFERNGKQMFAITVEAVAGPDSGATFLPQRTRPTRAETIH